MQERYEYELVYVDLQSADIEGETLKKLNEKGAEGWRLVPSFFFTKKGQMLFERKKE